MADDKSVDWDVWSNVPELYLWKAVALSLNLNPRSIQFNPNNWQGNQKIDGVPQEFDDRLLVAEGNLYAKKLPSLDRPGSPVICRVALDVFAAWALQLTSPWQLPERMAALANAAALKTALAAALEKPTAVIPPPEKSLSTKERETLLKLVIGLAIIAYKYDSSVKRSSVSTEIARDLKEHGISIDADTVRKYLDAASLLVPKKPGPP